MGQVYVYSLCCYPIAMWTIILGVAIAANTPTVEQQTREVTTVVQWPVEGFTPARPLNYETWITPEDYPADAKAAGVSGNVMFKVSISETGQVSNCQILEGSGSPALDARTCELIIARAKFEPAKNGGGEPIAMDYSRTVRWVSR